MVTVPPLQTSKTVFLFDLLRCSSSYFTVDRENFFVFLCLCCLTLAVLFAAEVSPRRWQLWQGVHQDGSGADADRQTLHHEPGPERVPGLLLHQPRVHHSGLRSSSETRLLPNYVRLQTHPASHRTLPYCLRLHQNLNWTTSTQQTCRQLLSMALDAGFSVGPVDRPAMVSKSAHLQGIQSSGESVVVCTCSADPQQCAFTRFSSLWPLAPRTFHDQYVRCVFTRLSAAGKILKELMSCQSRSWF